MAEEDGFDEDAEVEIKLLLLGKTDEVVEGFNRIDRILRKKVACWVRHRRPALHPQDLADVWQETLIDLHKMVVKEQFDADGSLTSLLCTIAERRAIDLIRKNGNTVTLDEEALAAVAASLRGTEIGMRWRALDRLERKEVLDSLGVWIRELPAKQRLVMQVFRDGYPETKKMKTLREQVSAASGEEETLASVKRALQEARKKLNEFLDRMEQSKKVSP